MRGWVLAEHGQCEEGIAELRQGLEMARQQPLSLGDALFLLAEAEARKGASAEARAALEEGLAVLSEEWFHESTLLQLRGELLAREDSHEAEASFREAMALAHQQGARMFELRATTSLARWLTERGRVAEARRLLAPLYASFTEGFDTRDLVEAKALLDELG